MKLALLIGASAKTKESPLIPLGPGSHRLHTLGLHDSVYHVVYENGIRILVKDQLIIPGDANIKLQQLKEGTELPGSISIFSELIPAGEEDKDGFIVI